MVLKKQEFKDDEIKKCKEMGHKSEEVYRLEYRLEPSNLKKSVVTSRFSSAPSEKLRNSLLGSKKRNGIIFLLTNLRSTFRNTCTKRQWAEAVSE